MVIGAKKYNPLTSSEYFESHLRFLVQFIGIARIICVASGRRVTHSDYCPGEILSFEYTRLDTEL